MKIKGDEMTALGFGARSANTVGGKNWESFQRIFGVEGLLGFSDEDRDRRSKRVTM